jgi:SOS response associated peptidase (SRAP)
MALLTVAGLWDEWKNRETGERLKSCTMIVGEPNDFAAEIHDRMPVFLTQELFARGGGAGISEARSQCYKRCCAMIATR